MFAVATSTLLNLVNVEGATGAGELSSNTTRNHALSNEKSNRGLRGIG